MIDVGGKQFRAAFAAVIIAVLLVALVFDVTRGEDDETGGAAGADASPSSSPEKSGSDSSPSKRSSGSSKAPSAGGSGEADVAPDLQEAMDGVPPRASGPRRLAEQIVVAERAIADKSTPGKVLAAAGHLQQVAYRVLGARPWWDEKVLTAVPGHLRPVVRDNVAARREFRSMHDKLVDTLPDWRIVRPVRAAKLRQIYRQAEEEFGVDWEYLAAVNLVETGMGRIRGTSIKGAQGPMQFMPGTWAQYGEGDVNDPRDAIMAAARYLSAMGFESSPETALRRYNNSAAYVRGVVLHAKRMQARPRAFVGYYHWQVYYLCSAGDVLLPVGYHQEKPIKVKKWAAEPDNEVYKP